MKILITGSNGFLGKRLASDLLNKGHELFLLVRNAKKLEAFLKTITERQNKQITIIEGDVTSHNLGLSEEKISEMIGKVDAIYHSAALLSFDPKDDELTYQVNVEGTRNTLDFALRIKCKKFLYVSTAYTVGHSVNGKEELYNVEGAFVNSYEKTKCQAEHIVMSYGNRLSVSILRPSIIIGDSVTGKAETSFGLYGIMKSLRVLKRKISRSTELEKLPFRLIVNPTESSNIVPVDYVSMVLLAALENGQNQKIYHVTNPNPPRQDTVFELIKEYIQLENLHMVFGEKSEFLREEEQQFNRPLAVFAPYLSRTIEFTCDNTKELLSKSDQSLLNMDHHMLRTIIGGFFR
ncbi:MULTISPECIES: SDR family NAD(P)-dependent oxidoreductase [Bacillus]|uniref:SDR family NAD(P)-dependent oxidoreductase n=1 Tax=Bacillus TaxID=1386 RepID=UPI00030F2699|nr:MULTISPECIES: SDR family oxidoreductase [Bacillus]